MLSQGVETFLAHIHVSNDLHIEGGAEEYYCRNSKILISARDSVLTVKGS